ncbi:TPR and ankyrin repeat-containing protein 1-like [Jatropha curcas]|uniref:TPR and ankyrin repeat-containing protein 1-like n=1 Tax=Jatropha curcas TaxID=180498 RepID=UPI00189620CD|nr:TPR and ankyrin repeat-containing protein 1-like [Jatropha curcas]
MDFVYIDEVQDLTMRQIALFKHICRNVTEGFIFSGDTAQTIARGIDFRFEDIRSVFYNEFVLGSKKLSYPQVSKIFHLSQNFRTHAGILKLAQSVIDLLYRFFPSFVDILSHETSLIFGEAPVWLEATNDENAIVTIFGSSGNEGTNFVGFGAEQVILVRDDSAKKEVYDYVGKQALVLTIMECRGLEFQDVLLYNFFGSSPLRNKWRVVYEYMKEQNLLDESSPVFNMAKHNVLCSELKQLYVAITRTRQRLWICENLEELSKPMFDYWKIVKNL